jgi:uncharacterized protein YggE
MKSERGLYLVLALVAFGSATAFAQQPGRDGESSETRGITVVGRAVVEVPPDRARVVLRFFPRAGAPAAASAISYDEAARDLVDAMKKAGVPEARFSLPIGAMSGPSVEPAVVATVNKPTRDLLEKLARDTVANLPESIAPAFQNFNLTTTLLLDDCTEPETRAQAAAMADARDRAARAAAAAGVTLGPILSISEAPAFNLQPCRDAEYPLNQGAAAVDPFGPLEIPVSVNATVTFAIR